jgi:hypothetical protein
MPNHLGGAIYKYHGMFAERRFTITPAHETIHDLATIASLKRGSKRESFRSLPDTIIVNNRNLPVRWVA